MSIYHEIINLYDERSGSAGWPRTDQSTESIGGVVILRKDGTISSIRSLQYEVEIGKPLKDGTRKTKLQDRRMNVPHTCGRTSGVMSNLFWDASKFSLGTDNKAALGKPSIPVRDEKTKVRNECFRETHLNLLEEARDEDLISFRKFLQGWSPEMLDDFPDAEPLLGRNFVFRVEDGPFLHEIPEVAELADRSSGETGTCIVTGEIGPIARIHPNIKGVSGAQGTGAHFTTYELAASRSYGKLQGENAPIGEATSQKFSICLNTLLTKGLGNRIEVGDTTVVFWCRSGDYGSDLKSENALISFLEGGVDNAAQQALLSGALSDLAAGVPAVESGLDPRTRVYILGISANASRLGVRFWEKDSLANISARINQFHTDCAILPNPFFYKNGNPDPLRPQRMLEDISPQGDVSRASPILSGALMRTILNGGRMPGGFIEAIISRIRAEGAPKAIQGKVDGRRAAILRGALIRNHNMEVPMALDKTNTDVAYLLGRLFAAYCYAEKTNQTRTAALRQKYMGSAMATPAQIFPILQRGYINNFSALQRGDDMKKARGIWVDRIVTEIIGKMPAAPLPKVMRLPQQGLFDIGFYHQDQAFYEKKAKVEDTPT